MKNVDIKMEKVILAEKIHLILLETNKNNPKTNDKNAFLDWVKMIDKITERLKTELNIFSNLEFLLEIEIIKKGSTVAKMQPA